MRKTTPKKTKPKKIVVDWTCKDCINCTPNTEFHTLSLKGEPTLGFCPHWKKSRCVLLSMDYCINNFKRKEENQ